MDVSKALELRRSIREFDTTHAIGDDEVRRLITLAVQAPSSSNLQHWRFVVIRDGVLRQKVREAAWGQAQITDASLLVAICADVQAWQKQPERLWANAPEAMRQRVIAVIPRFYGASEQIQRDAALYSVGLSGMALMLAATEMGYASCPVSGYEHDKVAKLINLPPDHIIGLLVTIGKPAAEPIPKPGQLPYEEIVFTDRF